MKVLGIVLLFPAALMMANPVYGDQRFMDNGDGTVTDQRLGLMWAKSDNQGDIGWKQAQAYAKFSFGLTAGRQYENWRLPTLDELQSLYDPSGQYPGYKTECGIVVKIVPQIRLSCTLVWSSDTALGSHLAFNYNNGNSFTIQVYDITGCRVLPVRTIE